MHTTKKGRGECNIPAVIGGFRGSHANNL